MQISQVRAFKEKLAHPTSKHLRTQLVNYFSAIECALSRESRADLTQEFMRAFEATARNYECWRGVSTEELEQSSEALESFITKEKHKCESDRILFAQEPEDQGKDGALLVAYRRYSSFLQARHLEISEALINDCYIQVAVSRTLNLRTEEDQRVPKSPRQARLRIELLPRGEP